MRSCEGVARDWPVGRRNRVSRSSSQIDKPTAGYDTKTTADRLHYLIRGKLAIERFFLVGHDIGSWITYPYAATYGDDLWRCVLIDGNNPGVTLPKTITVGPENWRSWHFLFHPVPDLPGDPDQGSERAYLEWFVFEKTANPAATYTDADLAEYERCFRQTGNLRGALAYYRAVYDNMAHNAELRSDVGDRSGIRVSAQPSSRRSAL